MKDKQILQVEAPVSASLPCQSQPTAAKLPVIHILIAIFVILTQGMILGSEGQTPVPPDHGSQAAQTQPPSLSLPAAQGRQHPSYQVFAGQLALPAIIVVDETTLEIGGTLKIDVSRLDQFTTQQKETLAGLIEVPVGVADKLLKSFSNSAPADAAQVLSLIHI